MGLAAFTLLGLVARFTFDAVLDGFALRSRTELDFEIGVGGMKIGTLPSAGVSGSVRFEVTDSLEEKRLVKAFTGEGGRNPLRLAVPLSATSEEMRREERMS